MLSHLLVHEKGFTRLEEICTTNNLMRKTCHTKVNLPESEGRVKVSVRLFCKRKRPQQQQQPKSFEKKFSLKEFLSRERVTPGVDT